MTFKLAGIRTVNRKWRVIGFIGSVKQSARTETRNASITVWLKHERNAIGTGIVVIDAELAEIKYLVGLIKIEVDDWNIFIINVG